MKVLVIDIQMINYVSETSPLIEEQQLVQCCMVWKMEVASEDKH